MAPNCKSEGLTRGGKTGPGAPADETLDRRTFLKATTGAAAAFGITAYAPVHAGDSAPGRSDKPPHVGPYNMILVISDQESHRLLAPPDYELPARAELRRRGVTFDNHYIAAAMCTPSRGVMFSGLPPQVNGVFDQLELGYVPSLGTDRLSMGPVMKRLGYTTAYYGKFELERDIIRPTDENNYTDALSDYGFDSFAPDGDKVGAPDQGYDTDSYTGAAAVRWLRTNALDLNQQGKPWFMVVSFVSPHDIMYADGNPKGQAVQASRIGATITPPPVNEIFDTQWRFPLSPSHYDRLGGPGRPNAQLQYYKGWSDFLGYIPPDREDMWRVFYNYYLNLIRDNDRNLQMIVDTLEELDLWDKTVVVSTADHGELAGSHGGLRGKGPFPYEEETHVPFVVVHPKHAGGGQCRALTSHIDLLPTLVGLTGARSDLSHSVVHGLPGHDFSPLVAAPESAKVDSIRPGALFNYVGLQTVDAHYLAYIGSKSIVEGRWAPPLSEAHPNLAKRGFISFTYDGRYKYARYYAPADFNTPTSIDDIFRRNYVELFDLWEDPHERRNLAMEAEKNRVTIMRMNALLNDLIADEVGANDGRFLPEAVRPRG